MLRPLTTATFLAAATAAAAGPSGMSGETIKATLAGSLVELDTPAGTTIPVRFGRNGLVSGEAGVLASVLGAAKDRGRWWTAGDRLCIKWFRWFDAEARCVDVRRDGQRIFWKGPDGRSGTGTIAESAPPVQVPPAPYALGAENVAKAEKAKPEKAKHEKAKPEPALAVVADVSAPDVIAAVAQAIAPSEAEASAAPQKSEAPRDMSADRLAARFAAASATPPVAAPAPKEVSSAAEEVKPATASGPETAPVVYAAEARASQPAAAARAARKATPTQSISTVTLASFRVAGVAQDDMLNVRSGPSEYAEPIGGLAPQSRGVHIVGRCFEAWCPVRHGRVSGWVNRYYLVEEAPGSTALNDAN